MKAKAAVLHEKGAPFKVEYVDIAEPKENEVLVKVVASGICHTDEVGRSLGYAVIPAVLGHEGSGIVEKVGSNVKDIEPGDHVVLTYSHCGECKFCVVKKPYACDDFNVMNFSGKMVDGTSRITQEETEINNFFGQSSFSTYAVVDYHSAIKVDKDVDLKLLGPLGCGYQTGAGAVLGHMNAQKGGTLVVTGMGAVGFGGLMAGIVAGCKNVIAVGGTPDKLKIALEIGATHVINRKEVANITEEIKKISEAGADYILDTSGSPELIDAGLKALGMLGHLTMVGLTPDITISPGAMMGSSQSVSSITEGCVDPHTFIPEMVSYVKDGRFPIEKLSTFYELEEINKAFEDQEKGRVIKPILVMPE